MAGSVSGLAEARQHQQSARSQQKARDSHDAVHAAELLANHKACADDQLWAVLALAERLPGVQKAMRRGLLHSHLQVLKFLLDVLDAPDVLQGLRTSINRM